MICWERRTLLSKKINALYLRSQEQTISFGIGKASQGFSSLVEGSAQIWQIKDANQALGLTLCSLGGILMVTGGACFIHDLVSSAFRSDFFIPGIFLIGAGATSLTVGITLTPAAIIFEKRF